MKQCPNCQSQYTDDTLQFCLQDGSPLQYVTSSQVNTVAFVEQETVVSNRPSNQINTPRETQPTNWQPNQFSSGASFSPQAKKSSPTVAVFLTAFLMLLFFSLVGIGAWLYLKGATPDRNGNLFLTKKAPYPEATAPTNASKITPMATPMTSTSNANSASNTASIDKEQIKKDVSQRVYTWKSAAEAHNLDSYMNNYADTVDYYNKSRISRSTVRADKQRAFTLYDSLNITLSNMSVTPDASGENATAVFDKEWVFEGAKRSTGKVRTQLSLKKNNGQWLITGEKDLKVYYTE
jgi:hypothetical protein